MTDPPQPPRPPFQRWYLESLVEGGRQLRRITLHPLPFRIGRLPGLGLSLDSDSVSKEHAELRLQDASLWVHDLQSKNGTFVNGERVRDAEVREGDILHFAQVEFRVGLQEIDLSAEPEREPPTVRLSKTPVPRHFVEGARYLPELIGERRVSTVFQPVVSLPSLALAGYEALGRGGHPQLPEMPLELFGVAAHDGKEAELSRLFRETALDLAIGHPGLPALFVNVHPSELDHPDLVASLVEARRRAPQMRLTLEVHEGALADLDGVDRLRTRLSRSGVGLAYDDFGAGQARLLELAEVPPHYLKFDMSFVRGIHEAGEARRRLLASLVSVARDLLVYTVAEGVESAAEADACMRIGFTHAQGFYFGKPRPLGEL